MKEEKSDKYVRNEKANGPCLSVVDSSRKTQVSLYLSSQFDDGDKCIPEALHDEEADEIIRHDTQLIHVRRDECWREGGCLLRGGGR